MLKVVCIIGYFLFFSAGAIPKKEYKGVELFGRILNIIQENYVEKVDQQRLIYAAIEGIMKELDPHSQHYPPEAYKEMKQDTSGAFGGIGIEITTRDNELTIITPIEGSPAFQAGIKPGDKIVKIGDKYTKDISIHECIQMLKGKIGTTISISIKRDGVDKPLDFSLVRRRIMDKSVSFKDFGHGVGYIRISQFQERTSSDFKKLLKAYIQENNNNINGLILDLRLNPGGILNQAVDIVDMFLSRGEIVSIVMKDVAQKQQFNATSQVVGKNFPVAVLINEGSASAAEIVAGALQDHNRAVLIGTKTFGKGTVQNVIDLEDGSGLKLTIAHYYTPSGRSFQAVGITPDIIIHQEINYSDSHDYVLEKNLKNHLKTKTLSKRKLDEKQIELQKLLQADNQLRSAYGYIRSISKLNNKDI